jgi:hypothetical protein
MAIPPIARRFGRWNALSYPNLKENLYVKGVHSGCPNARFATLNGLRFLV